MYPPTIFNILKSVQNAKLITTLQISLQCLSHYKLSIKFLIKNCTSEFRSQIKSLFCLYFMQKTHDKVFKSDVKVDTFWFLGLYGLFSAFKAVNVEDNARREPNQCTRYPIAKCGVTLPQNIVPSLQYSDT